MRAVARVSPDSDGQLSRTPPPRLKSGCGDRVSFARPIFAAAAVGDRPSADAAPGRWHYELSDALLASRAHRPTRETPARGFAIIAEFSMGKRRHEAANCWPLGGMHEPV